MGPRRETASQQNRFMIRIGRDDSDFLHSEKFITVSIQRTERYEGKPHGCLI